MSVNPSCISIETIRLWVEEGIVRISWSSR